MEVITVDVLLIVYVFVPHKVYHQQVVMISNQVIMHINPIGHFMEYLGGMFMIVIQVLLQVLVHLEFHLRRHYGNNH